jgi:hypothetical protein
MALTFTMNFRSNAAFSPDAIFQCFGVSRALWLALGARIYAGVESVCC